MKLLKNLFCIHLAPQGNIKCPDKDCKFEMEIDDGQRNLTRGQQQLMWSHVQNSHRDLFEKLF